MSATSDVEKVMVPNGVGCRCWSLRTQKKEYIKVEHSWNKRNHQVEPEATADIQNMEINDITVNDEDG